MSNKHLQVFRRHGLDSDRTHELISYWPSCDTRPRLCQPCTMRQNHRPLMSAPSSQCQLG